jgi:hypothetical protein
LIVVDNDIRVIGANRSSWNKIAGRRTGDPAEFFRDGGVSLEAFEQQLAG